MREAVIIWRVMCHGLLGFMYFSLAVPTSAHEIPDNFVERTVAVVVRDNVAELTYSAGLNFKTMRSLLQQWGLPSHQYAENVGDEELSKHFRQAAFNRLSTGLQVTRDGQLLKLKKLTCEPSSRHHFSLIARYQMDLGEPAQPISLELTDKNFPSQQGAIRCALKATGTAMVLQSNVAPIIVRAKRHELKYQTPKERTAVSQIKAKLGFVPESVK